MSKSDVKKASKSYNKEEVSDELSSPEGENKIPKTKRPIKSSASRKTNYKSRSKNSYNRNKVKSNSKITEMSPSHAQPKLNGSKSSSPKTNRWMKKLVGR